MIKHGFRKRGKYLKEYAAWNHMNQRCNNPKHHAYKNYGGRGIKVCERWSLFENFIEDVGFAPFPGHSLDRYPNNDGHYEPGNIRWATISQQQMNKRINGGYNGRSLSQISLELGGNRTLITKRLRNGWTLGLAATTPILTK